MSHGVSPGAWAARCLAAALLVSAVLVLSAQPKIGPMVGLRVPIYDYAKKGYWYFKPNPSQFQIDPDAAGTSDGIWSVKQLAAPGTNPGIVTGAGLVTIEQAGQPALVQVDTTYIMYRVWLSSGIPPVKGASCNGFGTGAMWIGRAGLFVCVPDQVKLDFVWARANLETN
jgi:hypothetical protein